MNPSDPPLRSEDVEPYITELLLTGKAQTVSEAESMFLDDHLDQIAQLAATLDDEQIASHEAVKLLMSHGSRSWEDSLK